MLDLDVVTQLVEASNISKVFGLDVKSFLTLILGSFIVGYTCLTFFYKIYYEQDNDKWINLNFSEKAIVSSFIGFLSILVSLFVVATWSLLYINNSTEKLEQLLSQFYYIFPFLYFAIISVYLTRKYNYKGLVFIKEYIWISIKTIFIFIFVFTLGILILVGSLIGILGVFVIIVLYIIAMKLIKKYPPF